MSTPENNNQETKESPYQEAYNKLESDFINYLEIPVILNVLIGKRDITVRKLLELEPGLIIDLKRSAGESLLLFLKDTFFAKGEVTVIEDTFGVRVTSFNDPREVGSEY